MSYYDSLMEMVIDNNGLTIAQENAILLEMDEANDEFIFGLEESVSDFIQKQLDRINSIGRTDLKKTDLTNPEKVKSALKNIESLDTQNKRIIGKAIVSLIITTISMIAGINFTNNADIKSRGFIATGTQNIGGINVPYLFRVRDIDGAKKELGKAWVCIGILCANIFWMYFNKNDYERLQMAIKSATFKIDKQIAKEKQKENPDKEKINLLNENKSKLKESLKLITSSYKEAQKELAKKNKEKENNK